MAEVPSLVSEAEELTDVNAIILETFKHCAKMKTDILEYTTDLKRDLRRFKENMVNLAEIQKDLSGLNCTLRRIEDNLPEDEEHTYEQVSAWFDDDLKSAMEDQFIPDDIENVINSVDEYINTAQNDSTIGAGDDDSQDIQVTSTTESFKDPLTKRMLEDPVKSKLCNHSYERSTIVRYLQKATRCPYSGCVIPLKKEDIVDDLEMRRKLLKNQKTKE